MRPVVVLIAVLATACSGPTSASSSPSSSPASSSRPVVLATGGIVEYAIPAPATLPPKCTIPCLPALGSLAAGPDRTIWFVDVGRDQVGRIGADGKIVQFAMPVPLAGGAQTIAAGPDHAMWVLGRASDPTQPDWILRVSPTGDVTKFPTESNDPGTESITTGPDGNLWFTEFSTSRIGKLAPSGAVTEYTTITPDARPRGIAAGPDGNLWFAETNRPRVGIGRISPQGQQTDFVLAGGASDAAPNDVAAGPDGNVWFTRWTPGGLGHISPSGEFVTVALPQGSAPNSVVTGPDGNVWFTDSGKNAIARISVAGSIREFPLPRRVPGMNGITVGGDGRIWFVEGDHIASIGVKVPEPLFSQPVPLSQRVMIFSGASPKAITVTNTGDATLAVGTVRVAGIDANSFAKGGDTCSGQSIEPGATCKVTVTHSSDGAAGIAQSALLEFPDNATGSPQKISLVAGLRNCRLPISIPLVNQPRQGGWLDLTTGHGLYDPNALFETSTNPPGVRTTAQPVLIGPSSAYFDSSAVRWLPVFDGSAVSPDGSRYAYTSYDPNNPGTGAHFHVVDVATGKDTLLPTRQGYWAILSFGAQGIYADERYEGIGPGLTLIDSNTGAIRQLLTDGAVGRIDGTTAWIGIFNTADKLPGPPGIGGGSNEIDRRDLSTGGTTPWFYAPGTNVSVAGLVNGSPVITIWDGTTVRWVLATAPNQSQPMDFPFATDSQPDYTGFIADPMGVWVGSPDGVYLWTARTGGILVSDEPATPAGTCA